MAHEIEIFEDGSAAFVTARKSAWHQLGTVLPEKFTAEDAMLFANLGGWNVRKVPAQCVDPITGKTVKADDNGIHLMVRDNPVTREPEVIGRFAVGDVYEPVQNEEHADVLNVMADENGAVFETAGSLRGGAQVFVTMKMPETMTIGGVDEVDLYVAALNNHDGNGSFTLLTTPIRVVCANTQAAALRNFRSRVTIPHTTNMRGRIQEAREGLGMTFKWAEEFQAEAERMIQEQLTDGKFWEIINTQLLPAIPGADPESRKEKNRLQKVTDLHNLFQTSTTMTAIRDTRWAGYQAVTEWLDHYHGKPETRALRTITSADVEALKNQAFNLFRVPATV